MSNSSAPSEDALRNAVESIVSKLDMESATLKNVRAQAEALFSCDLTDRKQFIKEVLIDYLQNLDNDSLETNAVVASNKKSSNNGTVCNRSMAVF